MLMKNLLRLAVIIGALPNTLANGQTADAVPLMADLNFIVAQVNANAAPLATTALLNVANSFTAVQSGLAATSPANFPIASQVQNLAFNTLSSVIGTNTISARISALPLGQLVSGQIFTFQPSQPNTGPVGVTIDGLGSTALTKFGKAPLVQGDLLTSQVAMARFDGGALQLIGGPLVGQTLSSAILQGAVLRGSLLGSATVGENVAVPFSQITRPGSYSEVVDSSTTISVNVGNVVAGDIVMFHLSGEFTINAAANGFVNYATGKTAGTATVTNAGTTTFPGVAVTTTTGSTGNYFFNGVVILKVTGSGTLSYGTIARTEINVLVISNTMRATAFVLRGS